jgi:NAD(P)-dependent dehydrogenase (short-subunit alcohol dehydrogenase family)
MTLTNRVVLVTGGGSGIGAAIATAFAAAGAQVMLVGRREAALREVAASVMQGPLVRWHAADVSKRDQVTRAVERTIAACGQIDILINNAGINVAQRKLAVLEPADWDALMAVNATGAFNMIHAVLPGMRERKDGMIINIASIAGVRPSALAGAAYNASKHALTALSTSVALEEAENGIRASLIAPGEVNTPLLDRRPVVPSPEARARILQPEDVAAAALFVASLHPRASVPQLILNPTIYPFS